MAFVTNDSAMAFSLVSIYDGIAPGNLSAQYTSAQLRLYPCATSTQIDAQ